MTKGQQIVLLIMIIMLLGVMVLLAITLIDSKDAASTVPTLAVLPTATAPPAQPPGNTPAPLVVPPTWTPAPTRTAPATNTPRSTHTATSPPTITPTFLPTFTPRPTEVVTSTPAGTTTTPGLVNPDFEGIRNDTIPGWSWWAEDNFTSGGEYSPDTSYETPLFKQADDPVRFIDGPTLQIDAVQHLKFKAHVFQTVVVTPTSKVGFRALASAFSGSGVVKLAAGIDPSGDEGCDKARWGEFLYLDQGQPAQSVIARNVVADGSGQVTVCLYAEPVYAAVSNAAFFDSAQLTVIPPRPTP
jgi:hypothetical protein